MSDLPMFYRSVVPLNRERHRRLRLREDGYHYGFSQHASMIPAVLDEFPVASRHLPIMFMPGAEHPTAVFITGLRTNSNAFVGSDGRWTGSYVPAYLRRYPFILGEVADQDPLACVDDRSPLFAEAEGEPLFDDGGADTPFLQQRVSLVRDYFDAAKRTEKFMAILAELRLLQGVSLEAKVGGSETVTIQGFLTVDEAKLNALPASDFLRLRRENLLAPIFAHLLSLASVDRLQIGPEGRTGEAPAVREAAEA